MWVLRCTCWGQRSLVWVTSLLPRGSWGSNSACQFGGKLLYSLSHLTGPKSFFFKVELCRSARGRQCEFCDLTHPDEAGTTHVQCSQIVPVMHSWNWHEDICLKALDEVAEWSTRVCDRSVFPEGVEGGNGLLKAFQRTLGAWGSWLATWLLSPLCVRVIAMELRKVLQLTYVSSSILLCLLKDVMYSKFIFSLVPNSTISSG